MARLMIHPGWVLFSAINKAAVASQSQGGPVQVGLAMVLWLLNFPPLAACVSGMAHTHTQVGEARGGPFLDSGTKP